MSSAGISGPDWRWRIIMTKNDFQDRGQRLWVKSDTGMNTEYETVVSLWFRAVRAIM